MTHKELVEIAYKWAIKRGSVGVVFKELNSLASNGEYPDIIGFGAWGNSLLIEVKASRADFLADKKKMFRKIPAQGMGLRRYYCCPTNLIKTEELPIGWGLIYVNEKGKAMRHHKPLIELPNGVITHFKHERNLLAEHGLMYSALRRLFLKDLVKHIYDKDYDNLNTITSSE